MAQDASGAQHSAEDRDGAQIVRTGTDARQGEIIMDKGDLLVWSAAASGSRSRAGTICPA